LLFFRQCRTIWSPEPCGRQFPLHDVVPDRCGTIALLSCPAAGSSCAVPPRDWVAAMVG
jgi:hypothetical protein